MKNFPDHDQFDELEKRLQSYTEAPDELVWENIDAALRPDRILPWLAWIDNIASAISIFVCVMAITVSPSDHTLLNSEIAKESESAGPDHERKEIPLRKQKNENSDPHDDALVNPSAFNKNFSAANKMALKPGFRINNENKIADAGNTTQSLFRTTDQKEIFLDTLSAVTLMVPTVDVPVDSLTQNQNETGQAKRIPKKRRPALYVNVTPSLSFQQAIPMGDDGVIVNGLSEVSILSAERFGLGLDVGVQGLINKRFEYYCGLSFYHQNQKLKYSYQSRDQVSVESVGDKRYTVTPKSFIGSINYEMLNLGIQAGILYNLYGKTLTHKIGAGVSYHHGLIKSNSGRYENSESSYFSYQVFYRNEVRVSPRLRFFIQPVFIQSIQVRERLDAPFNLKPYRAGIGFGILYDF